MKSVNVAEFRAHFGQYLAGVEQGEEVQICKRNKSVARILRSTAVPVRNGTVLGCARGTVRILGDIVAPAFGDDDWEMSR
jgi:antitoxin (DNA-binding transcriptional repressor) of toxin-antitoxin stability system